MADKFRSVMLLIFVAMLTMVALVVVSNMFGVSCLNGVK